MAADKVMQTRQAYDMANWSQRRDAAGLFYQVAAWGYDGSLCSMFYDAQTPHNWIPEHDGRTREGKEMAAASAELAAAFARYDRARRALVDQQKARKGQPK